MKVFLLIAVILAIAAAAYSQAPTATPTPTVTPTPTPVPTPPWLSEIDIMNKVYDSASKAINAVSYTHLTLPTIYSV